MCWPPFVFVALCIFLRDVWIRTQKAAVASRRATNLATHLPRLLKYMYSQVVDGGTGQYSELDINFRVMHPRGHPLVAEFKKSDGVFSQQIKVRIVHPLPEFND